MIKYFGKLQNAGVAAKEYSGFVAELTTSSDWSTADIDEQRDLAKVYTLYEQIKLETGTYDYNDQLAIPLELLRQRPNLRKTPRGRPVIAQRLRWREGDESRGSC